MFFRAGRAHDDATHSNIDIAIIVSFFIVMFVFSLAKVQQFREPTKLSCLVFGWFD
jgi:hypothetical protein